MTTHALKTAARRAMFNHLACEDSPPSATALAEAAAATLGHDSWLDEPDHWIWDLALEVLDLGASA